MIQQPARSVVFFLLAVFAVYVAAVYALIVTSAWIASHLFPCAYTRRAFNFLAEDSYGD